MKKEKTKGSRKIAAYSLLLMGAGFAATAPFQEAAPLELLHGGFEAGLVGGLADWFAVTALFRHPLGLKIPHTALLPNNRERMTKAIVTVVKNDWLSKESIHDKVKTIRFSEKVIESIEKKLETREAKTAMIKLTKDLVQYIDVEKMTPYVKKQLLSSLSQINIRPFLHSLSDTLLNEAVDQKALDYVLQKGEIWLRREETALKLGLVSMHVLNTIEADGFLQFALKSLQSFFSEEKLGGIIQNLLLNVLKGLKEENNPNRAALLSYLQKEIQKIGSNEKCIHTVETWKKTVLEHWEPEPLIAERLKQLKQHAIELVEAEGFYEKNLVPLVQYLLDKVCEKKDALDAWFQGQIAQFIEKNHDQIGQLVQENLNKLDNETLIDMVENNIGKDLQWIRVNGAVCGFAIGLVLTAGKMLLQLL